MKVKIKELPNIPYSQLKDTDLLVVENGKDTYYRGYANEENVLYKYHHHKLWDQISN